MSNDYYKAAKKSWFDFLYRQQLVETYGWAIPGDEAIKTIEELPGNYILEVGAGAGYWERSPRSPSRSRARHRRPPSPARSRARAA